MNKLQWNLQEIFTDNHSFYQAIENVKILLDDMNKYEKLNLDASLLLEVLDKKWQIKELSNNILIYGSLMYYKNINSDECIELKKVAETFNNNVDTSLKFIDRKILELGYEKILDFIVENPKLEIYKLSLDNLFRLKKHIQSDEINQEIKNNNNIINEQLGIYNNLLRDIGYGSINIDDEEVKVTASNFGKYISSRDRETRRQTYFTVNSSFQNEKDNFANLLNKIYECRIKNSALEKYNSVLEKILYEENIDPKIIDKLIESVNNNLDLFKII